MTTPSYEIAILPGEWRAVHGVDAAELEQELQREVPENHALHGLSVQAVAVRRHLKDAVFWVPSLGQWALVHLTRRVETDPRWPSATCTPSWNELIAELDD